MAEAVSCSQQPAVQSDESVLFQWMQIVLQFPFSGNLTISAPNRFAKNERTQRFLTTFNERVITINTNLGATRREDGRVTFFHRHPPKSATFTAPTAHAFFENRERVPDDLVQCVHAARLNASIPWPESSNLSVALQRASIEQALSREVKSPMFSRQDQDFRAVVAFYLGSNQFPAMMPMQSKDKRIVSSGWAFRVDVLVHPPGSSKRSRVWLVYAREDEENPCKELKGVATATQWLLDRHTEEGGLFPVHVLLVELQNEHEWPNTLNTGEQISRFATLFAQKCVALCDTRA